MRAWLITVGEPLPLPGRPEARLLRTGLVARELKKRGHEVLWWTSTFDHWAKNHHFPEDRRIEIQPGYELYLLKGTGYRRNLSPGRLLDHFLIGRKFGKLAPKETRPQIILCSLPTLELSEAAVDFGRQHGVPVVIDVRDQWPDIFLEEIPPWAAPLGRFLLTPLFRKANSACSRAAAVIGHTPAMVRWGLEKGRRPAGPWDRDFPHGYSLLSPPAEEMESAAGFWRGLGLTGGRGEFVVCFFGTFGKRFDIETALKAAEIIAGSEAGFKFVFCGQGDRLPEYRKAAEALPNVFFPGWVEAAAIRRLMELSRAGLAPYLPGPSFEGSIPNKVIEYLSEGLPVVSCLDGLTRKMIEETGCGLYYPPGDAAALAENLLDLARDSSLRRKKSEAAWMIFQKAFTAEAVYSDLVDMLEQIFESYRKEA